jgi:hypothetical protein
MKKFVLTLFLFCLAATTIFTNANASYPSEYSFNDYKIVAEEVYKEYGLYVELFDTSHFEMTPNEYKIWLTQIAESNACTKGDIASTSPNFRESSTTISRTTSDSLCGYTGTNNKIKVTCTAYYTGSPERFAYVTDISFTNTMSTENYIVLDSGVTYGSNRTSAKVWANGNMQYYVLGVLSQTVYDVYFSYTFTV